MKVADKDMWEITLQNVNKSSYFKPTLLDVEMYKLGYWPENVGEQKTLAARIHIWVLITSVIRDLITIIQSFNSIAY